MGLLMGGAPQGQSVANLIALVSFCLRGSIYIIILVTKILRRKNFKAWINQQHDFILIHIGIKMKKKHLCVASWLLPYFTRVDGETKNGLQALQHLYFLICLQWTLAWSNYCLGFRPQNKTAEGIVLNTLCALKT